MPADNISDIPNLLEKYPWEVWTDGELHVVDLEAYEVTKAAIRTRLHQKAEQIGKKVKTRTTEDEQLAIQFFDKPAE